MAWDTLRALTRLWKLGVDVVCDLEFFTRYSTMVAYLSGAPIRVGYWSRIAWRGNILTHPVYYNGMRHITRVFLAQAEVLGASVEDSPPSAALPRLQSDGEASRALAERIRAAGLDPDSPYMMINPNASELCLERRWMADWFAHVVDALLKENEGLQAIFVGARNERSYTGEVLALCREKSRTANLAGTLDPVAPRSARAAKLFLTVDSGPPSCGAHRHADRGAVRPGNSELVRESGRARPNALCRGLLQPLSQRVQHQDRALQRKQHLHAGDRRYRCPSGLPGDAAGKRRAAESRPG
jgi:ADP-heptose:LPS heptosyltransferase